MGKTYLENLSSSRKILQHQAVVFNGEWKSREFIFLSGKSFFMSGNYFLCRDNNKRANIGKNRVIFGANGSFK